MGEHRAGGGLRLARRAYARLWRLPGAGRVIRGALRRVSGPPPGPFQVEVPGGGTLRVPGDRAGTALNLWWHGVVEPLGTLVVRRLAPGCVFWDVGAHVGYFSVVAGRAGAQHTVAIEPYHRSHALLTDNLSRNGVAHDAFRVAAGDGAGEVALHAGPDGDSGVTAGEIATAVVGRASVVRLDELARAHALPAPGLLKIDVEGFEPRALRGMGALLDEAPPMLVEINARALSAAGSSAPELLDLLDTLGYGPLFDLGGRYLRPFVEGRTFNALALPRSRQAAVRRALAGL